MNEIYNVVCVRADAFLSDCLFLSIIIIPWVIFGIWVWRLTLLTKWAIFVKRIWIYGSTCTILFMIGSTIVGYCIDVSNYNTWIDKHNWIVVEGTLGKIICTDEATPILLIDGKRYKSDTLFQLFVEHNPLIENQQIKVFFHGNTVVKIETAYNEYSEK